MEYQDINAMTINSWVEGGWVWGTPVSHETFSAAKSGKWDIQLTPTKMVPHDWLGDVRGKKILGLASGGGQQMPILAAIGAECTVLDYSDKQLESEILLAQREGYKINAVKADMTKPLPFDNESFDIIVHPVSNCYVEKVMPIFLECYRILKHGGILICGLSTGIDYIVDSSEERIVNSLPFNPLINPEQMKQLQDENAGVQFSHTLEDQIGGQLKAGFRLTDLYEDTNEEGRLFELNIPSYIGTRAVKE